MKPGYVERKPLVLETEAEMLWRPCRRRSRFAVSQGCRAASRAKSRRDASSGLTRRIWTVLKESEEETGWEVGRQRSGVGR